MVVRRLALFLTTCRDSRNFISRCSPCGWIVTFLEIERLFLVRVGEKYYAMQEIRPLLFASRVCGHAFTTTQAFIVTFSSRRLWRCSSRKFLVWRERKRLRSFGTRGVFVYCGYSVILLREWEREKKN